ncbi:hypothetical protein GXW82_08645 [Streptacidiphilus sp. 4-A2]|nr:hypothetical protein [Streptacidiphilus sp. 4-A2]
MAEIAGDVGGLNGIRFQLGQAKDPLNGVVNYIDGVVAHLVSDTGWNGDVATQFTGAWEQDAAAVSVLASNVGSACAALGTLSAALSAAQGQCDGAARTAAAAGSPSTPPVIRCRGKAVRGRADPGTPTSPRSPPRRPRPSRPARTPRRTCPRCWPSSTRREPGPAGIAEGSSKRP